MRARLFSLALTAVAAAMGMGASPAMAQLANPPQVLTLDQDRLYATSLYGKALEAKSLAATQALAAENRRIEADLAAEEASLTEQRKTLTTAAFTPLAQEFDTKVSKIRAAQEAKASQLKADRDAGRKQFFDAVIPILADLMRQSGAYAILNHDSVVLSFDSIDVTDRAVLAIDATLGDGSTPAPTPTPTPAPSP